MPHTQQFNKLWKSVEKEYLGKPVPKEYQNKYGKTYDKGETKSVTYAIAKIKKIRIDK